jgi:hypothetical protein
VDSTLDRTNDGRAGDVSKQMHGYHQVGLPCRSLSQGNAPHAHRIYTQITSVNIIISLAPRIFNSEPGLQQKGCRGGKLV